MNAEETVERVAQMGEQVIAKLPDALVSVGWALAAAAVGTGLLVLGRKLLKKIFSVRLKKVQNVQRHKTWHNLLLSLFNFIMYFAIIMASLGALGVDVSSVLAVAGVGGVAIGFGCQTLVKDFVSGLFLWIEGRINVGDVVTVGGQTGRVEAIALRTTTLRSPNGKLFVIPNGDIRTVINMSRDYRCAVVDITVAHGQDLPHAMALLNAEMAQVKEKWRDDIDEAPVVMGVISTDARAACVRIECRCDVDEVWRLESDIRVAALEGFRREGIRP